MTGSGSILVVNAGASSAKFLLFRVDPSKAHESTTHGEPCIDAAGSALSAWVIPANEELMIARDTLALLGHGQAV